LTLATHQQGPDGHSGAIFSTDRRYRYSLWRRWGKGHAVLFIGFNPSTANEMQDDPTIRRCMGFAKTWGYDALYMGNLFALRSTQPEVIAAVRDPVGPKNFDWLRRLYNRTTTAVAAWGALAKPYPAQVHAVVRLLPVLQCLGTTAAGHPRHPLYVRANTTLVPFQGDL
jgi:hypothetical protein